MTDATIAPMWEIGPFDLPQTDMLSLNGRADRRTLSPRIRTLRMQARVMARAAHCPTFMRARLVAWVRFPDGRRRDLHNYMPAGPAEQKDRRYCNCTRNYRTQRNAMQHRTYYVDGDPMDWILATGADPSS